MDGLETLPEPRLLVDPVEGEVFLSPAEEPITLFDHSEKYYPLIPDLYRIVVVINEQRYYQLDKGTAEAAGSGTMGNDEARGREGIKGSCQGLTFEKNRAEYKRWKEFHKDCSNSFM